MKQLNKESELKMTNTIEERLIAEANFGDLVEVTLREGNFCALHTEGGITIFESNAKELPVDEHRILHAVGYYGGMTDTKYEDQGTQMVEHAGGEILVCLNPTVHDINAVSQIHSTGAGYVKVPLSAIESYSIKGKERRGLRVVN